MVRDRVLRFDIIVGFVGLLGIFVFIRKKAFSSVIVKR